MNQPFIFSPQINPYNDNARFLKKSFSSGNLLISIISLAVVLISIIFGAACIFSFKSLSPIIETQEEEMLNVLSSAIEGVYQVIYCMVMFLVLLAFVILYVTVKSDSKDTPAVTNTPFVLFRIFFVLTALTSFSTAFNSSLTPLFDAIISISEKDNISKILLECVLLSGLPSLICGIWAIIGFLFTNSVTRTVKCTALIDKFGKTYIIMSRIFSVISLIIPVVYCINGFHGGVFYSINGEQSIKSMIVESLPYAPVMLVIYYVACAVTLFFSSLTAKEYINAVSQAKKSFQLSGTNLFMNGDSSYADYYQQTYTVPQPASSAPAPVQIMPHFIGVSPSAFASSHMPGTPQQSGEKTQPTNNEPYSPTETQPAPVSLENTSNNVQTDSDQEIRPTSDMLTPEIRNGTYVCPRCGTINIAENKFCSACGNNCFGT